MSEQGLAEEAQKPKKRTFREIAKNYRRLGLPNAKKMRQASRIETLTRMNRFYLDMLKEAAKLNVHSSNIIRELIKEENFAVRGEVGEVLWVADDTAIENAKKYLKTMSETRASLRGQQAPPQLSTDSPSASVSESPPAQDGQL